MNNLSIIVAIAENRAIGKGTNLLWHISEDLKHFKAITSGHPIVMGRKTYESLGRPLPNRRNIVVSRNSDFRAEGCEVVGSLEEAIRITSTENEVFVIGGGQIYAEAIHQVSKLYLTVVHKAYEGDTFFPKINPEEWTAVEREDFERGKEFEYGFSFITYLKK